jgi:uncharacterized membrane protein
MLVTGVLFYDVVLAVHIAAIVVAFGVTFAYPILFPTVRRVSPAALPAVHAAQGRIGRMLITPAMVVALAAGIYLASDRHYWSETWVTVPFVILIVLFGLGGAFFAPRERKLAEISQRDVDASGGGEVRFSEEYETLSRQVATVGAFASLLVLVAVFFMAAKPFA